MKLLEAFDNDEVVYDMENLLRENGILTHVSGEHTSNMRVPFIGPKKIALWVVIDDQFLDAQMLLVNPDHKVKHKLTEEQMRRMEPKGGEPIFKYFSTSPNAVAMWVSIILVLVWLIYVLYQPM